MLSCGWHYTARLADGAWRLASVGWVSGDAYSVRDKFGYHPIGLVRRHDRFDSRARFFGSPER